MTCPHCATAITEDAGCRCPRMSPRAMANAGAMERLLAMSPVNDRPTPRAVDDDDECRCVRWIDVNAGAAWQSAQGGYTDGDDERDDDAGRELGGSD